jgi:hypothetical protein
MPLTKRAARGRFRDSGLSASYRLDPSIGSCRVLARADGRDYPSQGQKPMDDSKVTLPLWTIVEEARHTEVGLPTSTALLKDPKMPVGDFLPICASCEIAEAFIEAASLVGHVPLKLATRREVQFIFEALAKLQGDPIYVGFNAHFKMGHLAIRLVPVNDAIHVIVEDNPNGKG